MDETSRDWKRWYTFGLLALRVPVYLFIFLVMYVFSIGPMYWRWYDAYGMYDSHEEALAQGNPIALFYLPLMKACEQCRHVDEYVNWYIDFWV